LFTRVIDLLECWDVPESHDLSYEYSTVLWELKVKLQRLELRDAYSKIVSAPDEDARDFARIDYLRKRRCIGDVDVPELPF